MEYYLTVKYLHITCALLSVSLFVSRLVLDMLGKPGWRVSGWRHVPHINDTLLLVLACVLLALGPWQPFVHQWLGIKILLLLGYIMMGFVALKVTFSGLIRSLAAIVALLLLTGIFYLAHFKPILLS
ncbi:SirB2 family protein [Paraglaciecola mesophila]|nr:SirB2 family protein [Paraglaciecola mesophila]